MASSYSTDLKLELMQTGENAGTWGENTNNNLNLIQQAIAGFESVALSDGGTVALAMTDKAISNARNMVLKFTGTLTTASTVTIPDSIEKFYIFDLSAVTGVTNLTIKTVSGTGFTAGEAAIVAAYSDGTNLNEIALNTLGGTIATAQIDDAAISTAKLSDNAVTTAKISNLNVTEAKLAASAVTADKIAQSTITQAKLATDSVGPGASSGASGAQDVVRSHAFNGGATGTYTANPAANNASAFIKGGGGGGSGGGNPNNQASGGAGGDGGFGFYFAPITGGTGYPYSVGNGGGKGNGFDAGSPGGATNVTSIGTANGGNGGVLSQPGNPGSSPGAQTGLTGSETIYYNKGTGGAGAARATNNSTPGTPGFFLLYDNSGT